MDVKESLANPTAITPQDYGAFSRARLDMCNEQDAALKGAFFRIDQAHHLPWRTASVSTTKRKVCHPHPHPRPSLSLLVLPHPLDLTKVSTPCHHPIRSF